MDYESELKKISDFVPEALTHYYRDNEIHSYFAVIMKDGIINTTNYPTGRVRVRSLKKGENVICFKRTYFKKEDESILYLRGRLEIDVSDENKDLYEHIKSKYVHIDPYY